MTSILSCCRMERLQRVVSKVQMESGVCEEQLNQVEALLQAVRHKPNPTLCSRNQEAAL